MVYCAMMIIVNCVCLRNVHVMVFGEKNENDVRDYKNKISYYTANGS